MTDLYSRRGPTALVLSADPLGAALIGAALELYGLRAAFPRDGESPGDALRRVRPRALLVDAADAVARDSAMLGHAMMTGAGILFFGSPRAIQDVRSTARRYRATLLQLPRDILRLQELLPPTRVVEPQRET